MLLQSYLFWLLFVIALPNFQAYRNILRNWANKSFPAFVVLFYIYANYVILLKGGDYYNDCRWACGIYVRVVTKLGWHLTEEIQYSISN